MVNRLDGGVSSVPFCFGGEPVNKKTAYKTAQSGQKKDYPSVEMGGGMPEESRLSCCFLNPHSAEIVEEDV